MKQSGYLARQSAYNDELMHAAEVIMEQFMTDTLQITLHQECGWGFDRIMALTEQWKKIRREYKAALNCRDPECDVMQEHMDRVLVEIINGRMQLIPFQERYPNVKLVSYKGRKK